MEYDKRISCNVIIIELYYLDDQVEKKSKVEFYCCTPTFYKFNWKEVQLVSEEFTPIGRSTIHS